MTSLLVTHIRSDGSDADRRIDYLQGPWFGPSHIDTVINDILSGPNDYHVATLGGITAPLEVLRHPRSGRLYLRTVPDGVWDNNLYSLPEIV